MQRAEQFALLLFYFWINRFCGCWRWVSWSWFLWFLDTEVQGRIRNFIDLKGMSSSQLGQCHWSGPQLVRCDSASPPITTLKLLALEMGFCYPLALLADILWLIVRRDRLWYSYKGIRWYNDEKKQRQMHTTIWINLTKQFWMKETRHIYGYDAVIFNVRAQTSKTSPVR